MFEFSTLIYYADPCLILAQLKCEKLKYFNSVSWDNKIKASQNPEQFIKNIQPATEQKIKTNFYLYSGLQNNWKSSTHTQNIKMYENKNNNKKKQKLSFQDNFWWEKWNWSGRDFLPEFNFWGSERLQHYDQTF